MKSLGPFLILLTALVSFAPKAALASNPTLIVGNSSAPCPAAEFSTIQAAVNAAAPGETIKVCAGIYPEQVSINKNLIIAGENGAIVMPGSVAANASGASSGEPIAAIILVQNAQDVTIRGLIVDGSGNGLTQCSPALVGILYQNASGTVVHNAVRSISTPTVPGCQGGDAILVETSSGLSSAVDVRGNSVHDYQKNGITGNEMGTAVTIHNNTVTESAPSAVAAPNGIQVGFGAGGAVTGNTVAGNVFAPCVSTTVCTAVGSGILIAESDGVTVQNNSVSTSQFGIVADANNTVINNNSVSNSLIFEGVVVTGNGNQVTGNNIVHSDEDAIFLQGNNNTVAHNTVIDALVGILTITGSTGNTVLDNTFFATVTTASDPAPAASVRPVPVR